MSEPRYAGKIAVDGTMATLDWDGVWRSDQSFTADWLNLAYHPGKYGPADGFPRQAAIHQAAHEMGGEILEIAPPPEVEPGTIF